MSALGFLVPDVSADSIVARSPMERAAAAAGARFEHRDGWNVASGFDSPETERRVLEQRVGFLDRSSMTKLELQGAPDAVAAAVASASGGLALRPGEAQSVNGTWWCPVTASRVLALGEAGGGESLRASLAEAVADQPVTVVEVTCGLAALALIGPGCRELLARFCAIDVRPAVTPVAGFRPGSIARTPGYLLCEDRERLLIMVGWALGQYLWEVVADAAEHLGGGPVGANAVAELQRA